MKKYVVFRNEKVVVVAVVQPVDGRGAAQELAWIPAHSKRGFDCGCVGPEAFDLALAILADHFCVQKEHRELLRWDQTEALEEVSRAACLAWAPHFAFADGFVSPADRRDGFEITTSGIDRFLAHWGRGAGDGAGGQQDKRAGVA